MEEDQGDDYLPYWLALSRISSVGILKLLHLLEYFKSPEAIFQADKKSLSEFSLSAECIRSLQQPDWHSVDNDLRWAEEVNNHFIPVTCRDYPKLLKEIPDPPIGIYVKGDKAVLQSTQIGIVGSRNPTASGKRTAHEFACELAGLGFTITSGLAVGIDSAAHQGALEAKGKTVAVLGNGLNTIYPKRNSNLSAQICEKGALLSEFPLEYGPIASNFPRRNRIISGLGAGVLVVEAAIRSGSLITARHALEQGREVFAVPGSIHNPLARGCHALLQQGAKLTEKIQDIVEELGPAYTMMKRSTHELIPACPDHEKLDEGTRLLFEYIGYQPVAVDDLIECTALQAGEISSRLLDLELKELIESLPGGTYIRRS